MIRHIVAFQLSAGDADRTRKDAQFVKEQLEALAGLIQSVQRLHVGLDLGAETGHWEAVLVSEFANPADLDAYQVHPEHVRVVGEIGPLIAARAIVDYEFTG